MRRRNNTHCQFEEPKEIDRFKKRNPARILFAQQLNYSMTINDQLQSLQKNSTSSSSSNSKINHLPLKIPTEDLTMEESKPLEEINPKIHNNQSILSETNTQLKQVQKSQRNQNKERQFDKDSITKKSVVVIGDSLQYEQKTKGFRKGMRRRYSHKNQADYMTY